MFFINESSLFVILRIILITLYGENFYLPILSYWRNQIFNLSENRIYIRNLLFEWLIWLKRLTNFDNLDWLFWQTIWWLNLLNRD